MNYQNKIAINLLILIMICAAGTAYALPPADPLVALRAQVGAVFGTGSTVTYCIYIAEVILGAVSYIKTKNLMLLLGVPILMLFTHAMFTYIAQ